MLFLSSFQNKMIQTFIHKQFVFFQVENKNFSVLDLEKHETKDIADSHINGELTVIWRNWDKIIHDPEMIYVNSVNHGEIKGPHLHKNRTSYFHCLQGKITLIIKDKIGKFHEIETNSDEPTLIYIPKNISSAHLNSGNEIARILTLADVSWKPNDNEMKNITFNDYDWKKWKV